jgi:hypothetical protein
VRALIVDRVIRAAVIKERDQPAVRVHHASGAARDILRARNDCPASPRSSAARSGVSVIAERQSGGVSPRERIIAFRKARRGAQDRAASCRPSRRL